MTLSTLANRVIAECAQRAADAGYALPPITLAYDLRGRSALGRCILRQSGPVIRLSPSYHAALGDKYADTIAHEYAHAVDFWNWPRDMVTHGRLVKPRGWSAHGAHWRRAMHAIGYVPNRTATREECELSREVPKARRTRKWHYACPTCAREYWLNSAKHHYHCHCRAPNCRLAYTGREELR